MTPTVTDTQAFVQAAFQHGLAAQSRSLSGPSSWASALFAEWCSDLPGPWPEVPGHRPPHWESPSGDWCPLAFELQRRVELAFFLGLAVVTARRLKRRTEGPPACPPGAYIIESLAPVAVEHLCTVSLDVDGYEFDVVAEARRHLEPLCRTLHARVGSMCEVNLRGLGAEGPGYAAGPEHPLDPLDPSGPLGQVLGPG